ncbi:MAG: PIN domain-containing protein [Eubacterium sp.]|nr:PIN domain-containing protein [Eubacterium sp.]MBR1675360.1 PIN domain-containing protein [Eubacterium sp.]
MKYISSDTNIWFDFLMIDQIELPFKLDYTYLIHHEVLDKEAIHPPGLTDKLIRLGLVKTEMDTEEFYDVFQLSERYNRISIYDAIALSIAKHRKIPVLTGDKALRKAAQHENVMVLGTLGLLDEAYYGEKISGKEYLSCLDGFLGHPERRLPVDEIQLRIKNIKEKGRG